MVANEKTHFFHLLKKLWQWGAMACLINMMHYGVAMGQCVQPPTVLRVSNTAPFGTVEIKRTSTTNSSVYKTEFNVNTAPCTTSKDIFMQFGTPTSLTLTISNNILTARYSPLLGGSNCFSLVGSVEFLLVNCKNAIGQTLNIGTSLRSGLAATITIDVNALCASKTGIIAIATSANEVRLNSSCQRYKFTFELFRNTDDLTLQSGSNINCATQVGPFPFSCLTEATISYSSFRARSATATNLFVLSNILSPLTLNYVGTSATCAVTLPPLVVMPKMTPDKVTATKAGEAIPGTTIDLPITLNCQNADNQAKVFTWTFTTPSADGFSILNDPSLNIAGGVSSAGISAQIFSTVDLTGRDKVKFTENPTLVKNSRSYIATPTSNTTIVPHKVRLIRNSETTKEGTFISKATFTVEYQ
ncbi:hypothetical protein MCERE1_00275 [Burkholderiaceae bacterium]